jgi:hypothetical protein
MNAARIQQQIEALRVELASKLDALSRAVAEETSDTPPPLLMSVVEYASHASVSTTTVKRWLAAGLPCQRRGRVVRIRVADADAWTPGASIAASAKRAAHGGSR